MPVTRVTVYACECIQCQGKWNSRTLELPKRCPFCKSRRWNDSIASQRNEKRINTPNGRAVLTQIGERKSLSYTGEPNEPHETVYEKLDW